MRRIALSAGMAIPARREGLLLAARVTLRGKFKVRQCCQWFMQLMVQKFFPDCHLLKFPVKLGP